MNKISHIKKIVLGFKYPITAINLCRFFLCKKLNLIPKFNFPILVTLFITERCNLKCPMCFVWKTCEKHAANDELSIIDWKKVIKEIGKNNSMVSLTGGEPLLNKNLFQIIKFLKKEKIICGITTNGVLLKKYANELLNSKIDFISVSLDGPKDIHDKSRGIDGTYDKVLEGITELVKCRGLNKSPNIKFNCVIQKENVNSLDEVISIANKLCVDEVSFQHLSFFNHEIELICKKFELDNKINANLAGMRLNTDPLDLEDIKKLYNFYQRIPIYEKKFNLKISFKPLIDNLFKYYSFNFPSNKSICYNPWINIVIRADGTAELCDGFSVGNIMNSSIEELFHSTKINKLRSCIKNDKIMPFCFRCCALNFNFSE